LFGNNSCDQTRYGLLRCGELRPDHVGLTVGGAPCHEFVMVEFTKAVRSPPAYT